MSFKIKQECLGFLTHLEQDYCSGKMYSLNLWFNWTQILHKFSELITDGLCVYLSQWKTTNMLHVYLNSAGARICVFSFMFSE